MHLLKNKYLLFIVIPIIIGTLLFVMLFILNTISSALISNKIISLIVKVVSEEFFKIFLYFLAFFLVKSLNGDKWQIYNSVLFSILFFGFIENIFYFISFQTEDVFLRLIYSYPIHIVTAILYYIAFVSAYFYIPILFIAGAFYHCLLNINSSMNKSGISYVVFGLLNLIILTILIILLKELNIRRTLNVK